MKIIDPTHERNIEIYNILLKIKHEVYTLGRDSAYFEIFLNGRNVDDGPTQSHLAYLKEEFAVEFDELDNAEMTKNWEEYQKIKHRAIISEGYLVKPIEPKFSKMCEEYEGKVNPSFSVERNNLFVFYITEGGAINRKEKINGDRPYKMETGKLRHRILLELMKAQSKSNNFYDTNELASVLEVSTGKIRDAVAGIKIQLVKNFKGIRRDDFIESAKNSGYRLHKQIRIIKT